MIKRERNDDLDQWNLIRVQSQEIATAHSEVFDQVREVMADWFARSRKRKPAIKLAVPPDRTLRISPGKNDAVDVELATPRLRYVSHSPQIALTGNGPIVRGWGRESESDTRLVVEVLAAFLADPASAFARHGGWCGICGRMLTDPRSLSRGIGPECMSALEFFALKVKIDQEVASCPVVTK